MRPEPLQPKDPSPAVTRSRARSRLQPALEAESLPQVARAETAVGEIARAASALPIAAPRAVETASATVRLRIQIKPLPSLGTRRDAERVSRRLSTSPTASIRATQSDLRPNPSRTIEPSVRSAQAREERLRRALSTPAQRTSRRSVTRSPKRLASSKPSRPSSPPRSSIGSATAGGRSPTRSSRYLEGTRSQRRVMKSSVGDRSRAGSLTQRCSSP
jgi:hypothetical protein